MLQVEERDRVEQGLNTTLRYVTETATDAELFALLALLCNHAARIADRADRICPEGYMPVPTVQGPQLSVNTALQAERGY